MSRLALRPTLYPIQWVLGILSLMVKQLGHEVDHSVPSSAQVKSEWSYTSPPFVCSHGVDGDNVTFLPSPGIGNVPQV